MMSLDEAIRHSEDSTRTNCSIECAREHEQLAEWLRELKQRKEKEEENERAKMGEDLEVQISWPEFTFPPVNLTISVPAWFFYATPAERGAYFEGLLK